MVTLYNKDGKRMTDWENPDWAEYEKETDDEGIWMWDWILGVLLHAYAWGGNLFPRIFRLPG